MAKVLVLYYSTYGHIEKMAEAVAEGARAAGATVELKRVPETVPEHIARPAHFKLDQPAPIATVDELPDYDAIIIGAPTRYGRMPSQMAAFLDQTGGLWARGALHGKVGAAQGLGVDDAAQRCVGDGDLAVDHEGGGAPGLLHAANARCPFRVQQPAQAHRGDQHHWHQDGRRHQDQVSTGFHPA